MSSQAKTEYTIYFAGPLFDHKDLIGNAILSTYIDKVSEGKYRCIIPQNLEQATDKLVDIRNQDLSYVLACDLAIFNFDGTELSSGTVVEFLYAKLLDIPSVIIRSDFRGGGDQGREGDRWNLMASYYPRTRKLEFNSMEWYQREKKATSRDGGIFETADNLYKKIAQLIIDELDAVMEEPPLLSAEEGQAFDIYKWASLFPGNDLKEVKHIVDIEGIINTKKSKGLLN
jgi:nucleoside 2-deoxyribosyltransferase